MELFELNTMQPSVGSSLRDLFIQLVQVSGLEPCWHSDNSVVCSEPSSVNVRTVQVRRLESTWF